MPDAHECLSRVLGYEPIRISVGVKRAIWSSLQAIPLAILATGISDSTAVSDAFRYVVAPGTMLAVRVVRVAPTHRGLGVFLDAMHWYTTTMSFALLLNAMFYALFIFSVVTIISGLKRKKAIDSCRMSRLHSQPGQRV
jgi:uncharacterized membrane protein